MSPALGAAEMCQKLRALKRPGLPAPMWQLLANYLKLQFQRLQSPLPASTGTRLTSHAHAAHLYTQGKGIARIKEVVIVILQSQVLGVTIQ